MRVENLYSDAQLLKTSNLHLTKLLENQNEVEIDQTLSNQRILIYSISVLSGLVGIAYKYLPDTFRFLLPLSVFVYFASQSVIFVLENTIYSKTSFIVRHKRSKFNVYTHVDAYNAEFRYSVFPMNESFNPNSVERIPLGSLFYEDGNLTSRWEKIASDIVKICKQNSNKYK